MQSSEQPFIMNLSLASAEFQPDKLLYIAHWSNYGYKSSFFKLVQCQSQLDPEIQPFVIDGGCVTHT